MAGPVLACEDRMIALIPSPLRSAYMTRSARVPGRRIVVSGTVRGSGRLGPTEGVPGVSVGGADEGGDEVGPGGELPPGPPPVPAEVGPAPGRRRSTSASTAITAAAAPRPSH